jgi:hypothetical protein
MIVYLKRAKWHNILALQSLIIDTKALPMLRWMPPFAFFGSPSLKNLTSATQSPMEL